MDVVPAAIPLTNPPAPIVAVAVLPLLHTPPGVTSLHITAAPAHTLPAPVIAAGIPFTVTIAVFTQPLPNE